MNMNRIRPVALCLFQHKGRILVSRAYDAVKQDFYCRPLGGGIEFGKRGVETIAREIREELGAEIEKIRWLGTLENLFTGEGKAGHEIVLVFDAGFIDRSLYDQPIADPARIRGGGYGRGVHGRMEVSRRTCGGSGPARTGGADGASSGSRGFLRVRRTAPRHGCD